MIFAIFAQRSFANKAEKFLQHRLLNNLTKISVYQNNKQKYVQAAIRTPFWRFFVTNAYFWSLFL